MIDVLNDPNAVRRAEIFTRMGAVPSGELVSAGKALCLTADNSVVDATDPAAEFVLVGEFGFLPADLAKELGIKAVKPKPKSVEAGAQTAGVSGLTITHDESAVPVTMGTPATV